MENMALSNLTQVSHLISGQKIALTSTDYFVFPVP